MRTVAFFNQKGGVGKTSLAVNYAYHASRAGRRTLLWDLDPQASATYIMRVDDKLAPRAKRLLDKKIDLEDLAVRSNFEGLMVVPASNHLRLLAEKIFVEGTSDKVINRAAQSAKGSFDLLVIDAPPSLNSLSDAVLSAIDLLCVPIQPSPLAMHSLENLLEHLRELKLAERTVAVYNMVDMRRLAHRAAVNGPRTTGGVEILSAYVPYSADMEKMALERNPIYELAARTHILPAMDILFDELDARMRTVRSRNARKR
ncbi:MAG: AAA family ATPase [Actinomycetota bacterium]|nr:AAA family ATPase [Actinomycetota bacterium]